MGTLTEAFVEHTYCMPPLYCGMHDGILGTGAVCVLFWALCPYVLEQVGSQVQLSSVCVLGGTGRGGVARQVREHSYCLWDPPGQPTGLVPLVRGTPVVD